MAESRTLTQPRNEVLDVADAISKLAPIFLGSQTQKNEQQSAVQNINTLQTQTATMDPNTLAQSNDLFNTLLARGGPNAQTDALVEDIMHRAAIAFSPVLAAEKGAGLYDSSTRKLLGSEAMARSVAAASEAVLKNQQQALDSATSLVNAKTAATTTKQTANTGTTGTTTNITGGTRTPPLMTLGQAALGAGASVAFGKAYDQLFKKAAKTPTTPFTSKLFGEEEVAGSFADAFNLANPEVAAFVSENPTIAAAIQSNLAGPSIGGGADFFTTVAAPDSFQLAPFIDYSYLSAPAAGATAAEGFSAASALSAVDEAAAGFAGDVGVGAAVGETGVEAAATEAIGAEGIGAAEGIGGEFVGLSGEEAAAGLAGAGAAAGGFEAAGGIAAADEIIGGILGADALAGAGTAAAVAEGGSFLAEVAPLILGWVVCTELVKGGELSPELYKAGTKHFQKLHPRTVRGYHFWAVPYTRWMRRSSFARRLMLPVAAGRIKYYLGEKNFLGWVTIKIIEPICSLIGRFCGKPDYRSLYGTRN